MITTRARRLTKLSSFSARLEPTSDDKKILMNMGEVAAAPLGIYGAAQVYRSGDLTGRKTLYHGTPKKSVNSILENGILPTTEKNVVTTDILKDISPDAYQKSMGKAYLSPDKSLAAGSGAIAEFRSKVKAGTIPTNMRGEVIKRFQGGPKEGLIEVNAPTWKMNVVRNPEIAMGFEKWLETQKGGGEHRSRAELKRSYDMLDKKVVAIDGGVSPEYVKGSKSYKRVGLGEIRDYITKNKGRALPAIGKAGLGLGVAGLSVYDLIRRNRSQKPAQAV